MVVLLAARTVIFIPVVSFAAVHVVLKGKQGKRWWFAPVSVDVMVDATLVFFCVECKSELLFSYHYAIGCDATCIAR